MVPMCMPQLRLAAVGIYAVPSAGVVNVVLFELICQHKPVSKVLSVRARGWLHLAAYPACTQVSPETLVSFLKMSGSSSACTSSPASSTFGSKSATKRKLKTGPGLESALESTFMAIYHDAVKEIVEHLEKNPDKVLPTLQVVRGDGLLKRFKAAEEDISMKPFAPTYVRFKQMPKDVICALLCTVEPEVFSSIQVCKSLEKSKPGTLHCLLNMSMAITEKTKWPKAAHNKPIFHQLMVDRYSKVGRRLSGLKLTMDGKGIWQMDWQKFGVYTLLPEGEVDKTQVKHISGEVAELDSNLNIAAGTDYIFENNWSELDARLRVGRISQNAGDFFGDDLRSSWASNHATEDMSKTAATLEVKLSVAPATPQKQAGRSQGFAAAGVSSAVIAASSVVHAANPPPADGQGAPEQLDA
jgi:hypothetical protein